MGSLIAELCRVGNSSSGRDINRCFALSIRIAVSQDRRKETDVLCCFYVTAILVFENGLAGVCMVVKLIDIFPAHYALAGLSRLTSSDLELIASSLSNCADDLMPPSPSH